MKGLFRKENLTRKNTQGLVDDTQTSSFQMI